MPESLSLAWSFYFLWGAQSSLIAGHLVVLLLGCPTVSCIEPLALCDTEGEGKKPDDVLPFGSPSN